MTSLFGLTSASDRHATNVPRQTTGSCADSGPAGENYLMAIQ